MIHIVLFHEFNSKPGLSENVVDPQFLPQLGTSWITTYLYMGYYYVDVFLFMGGYVSIVSQSKSIDSFVKPSLKQSTGLFLLSVFKRYVRIAPTFGVMMWFNFKIVRSMMSGPLSAGILPFWKCTNKNLFEALLLVLPIQDYNAGVCTRWTWYLSVDFRLFLTATFILIATSRYVAKTKLYSVRLLVFVLLASASTVYSLIATYVNKVPFANTKEEDPIFQQDYYVQVYHRGVVYFIGCLYGLYTLKPRSPSGAKTASQAQADIEQPLTGKEKDANKRRYNYAKLAFFLSIFAALTVIFHYYFQCGRSPQKLPQSVVSLFLVFGKIAFTIGLIGAFITFNGIFTGFSTWIAQNRLIQLIANTSYSCYLFHQNVIKIRLFRSTQIPQLAIGELFVIGLTDLTYCVAVALAVVLLIEAPTMHLCRVYIETPLQAKLKTIK